MFTSNLYIICKVRSTYECSTNFAENSNKICKKTPFLIRQGYFKNGHWPLLLLYDAHCTHAQLHSTTVHHIFKSIFVVKWLQKFEVFIHKLLSKISLEILFFVYIKFFAIYSANNQKSFIAEPAERQ